jgi:hypothetical protein
VATRSEFPIVLKIYRSTEVGPIKPLSSVLPLHHKEPKKCDNTAIQLKTPTTAMHYPKHTLHQPSPLHFNTRVLDLEMAKIRATIQDVKKIRRPRSAPHTLEKVVSPRKRARSETCLCEEPILRTSKRLRGIEPEMQKEEDVEVIDMVVFTGGWHVGGSREGKRKFARTLSNGTSTTVAEEESESSTQSTLPDEEFRPPSVTTNLEKQ